MRRPEISPQAREDILEIVRYLISKSPYSARKLYNELNEEFKRLVRFPNLGRARHDLGHERRSIVHKEYVIFYRPTEDGIRILRVIHGRRDMRTLEDDFTGEE